MDLTGIELYDIQFKECILTGSQIKSCELYGAKFISCNLKGVCLEALSVGIDFKNSNLEDASLYGECPFEKDDFLDANLNHAYIGELIFENEIDLEGCNFSNVNAKKIQWKEANLKKINLEGANLEGANLKGANLKNVNFTNANLTGCYILEKEYSFIKEYIKKDKIIICL